MGTGILIIAHAPLAAALKACVAHILPECDTCLATFDVKPHMRWMDEVDHCYQIAQHLSPPQTLIMTDVIGATPYNLSYALLEALAQAPQQKPSRLVSGTNVPMIFRALTYHQKPIDELVTLILAGGIQGIQSTSVASPHPPPSAAK